MGNFWIIFQLVRTIDKKYVSANLGVFRNKVQDKKQAVPLDHRPDRGLIYQIQHPIDFSVI